MRTCFVLPGILGSELGTPDLPGLVDDLLWVQTTRLALGQFKQMALAANGIDPMPPDGERCEVRGYLRPYYGMLARSLESSLTSGDWRVEVWPYDWRKATFTNGELFTQRILAIASPEEPCAIVAHSLGGLVARAAWAILSASAQSDRIARLVTLGTPHRGAYSPTLVWSLSDDLVVQLPALVNAISGFAQIIGPTLPQDYTNALKTSQVASTWPALYELLPLVDAASEIVDPLRPALFNLENWPADRQLSALHLERAATIWRAFLLSPVTMPPANVLTTVGGTGFATPWYLRDVSQLGKDSAIGDTDFGDGKVAIDSALVLPGHAYAVGSNHAALPSSAAILERIAEWVTADHGPDPPPDAPGEFLTGSASSQAGPPYVGTVSGFPDW